MANSKARIWELDALRGFCILCVIVVHFLFDLSFFGGINLSLPAWYVFLQEYGGAIFVLLSGCCATLGSRSVRRGLIVFGAGMLITTVTYGMYRLGMSGSDVVVKFGVLHLLGFDHESDRDANVMEARETKILAQFGYPDPYA